LDELFTDHFMQGVYKHIKGAGEAAWTFEDYDETFGEDRFSMSNPRIWEIPEGRQGLELALADRLFEHRVAQCSAE
jgi:hypothetical protein